MRPKILSDWEIDHAKRLRDKGYSNREIANIFEVGKTTIWDNVYSNGKRARRVALKKKILSFKKVDSVVTLIQTMKRHGFNSHQVAIKLDIPLREVNFIWTM